MKKKSVTIVFGLEPDVIHLKMKHILTSRDVKNVDKREKRI